MITFEHLKALQRRKECLDRRKTLTIKLQAAFDKYLATRSDEAYEQLEATLSRDKNHEFYLCLLEEELDNVKY